MILYCQKSFYRYISKEEHVTLFFYDARQNEVVWRL